MKKFLLLGMALLLLGSALFADDAKVMPARVGRLYLAPTFSFIPGAYDEDGDYDAYDDGPGKVMNLGAALEFGVNDWVTAAVQWAPGWTFWSDIWSAAPPNLQKLSDDLNTNGVADLFVGAKIQIAGANAPLATEAFRFAVAPGVVVPLPGPDFNAEIFDNAEKGDPATIASMDRHVFAAGGRFYFDYNFSPNFFINLYNETIFYPLAQYLDKDGPNLAALKQGILQGVYNSYGGGVPGEAARAGVKKSTTDKVEGEVNYKYKLTFEMEPVFTTPIADGLSFTAGLPVNYVYRPAYEYSVDNVDLLVPLLQGQSPGIDKDGVLEMAGLVGKASHMLSVKPNASLFLTSTPLPLEFKLQYQLPVWGKNAMANHNITLQIKAYFQI